MRNLCKSQAANRGPEPPLQTMPANRERTVSTAPYPGYATTALAPEPEREPEPGEVKKPAKAKRVRRKAGDVPANKPAAPTRSRGKKGGAGTWTAAAAAGQHAGTSAEAGQQAGTAGADAAESAGGNGVVVKGRRRGRPRNASGLDEVYEWFPGQFQWYHTFSRLFRLFPDIPRTALHCLLDDVDGDIVRAIDNVHFIRTCLSGGYADIIVGQIRGAHAPFQAQHQTVPRPLFRAPLKLKAPNPPRVHAQAVVQPNLELNVAPQPVQKNIHPAKQVVNGTGALTNAPPVSRYKVQPQSEANLAMAKLDIPASLAEANAESDFRRASLTVPAGSNGTGLKLSNQTRQTNAGRNFEQARSSSYATGQMLNQNTEADEASSAQQASSNSNVKGQMRNQNIEANGKPSVKRASSSSNAIGQMLNLNIEAGGGSSVHQASSSSIAKEQKLTQNIEADEGPSVQQESSCSNAKGQMLNQDIKADEVISLQQASTILPSSSNSEKHFVLETRLVNGGSTLMEQTPDLPSFETIMAHKNTKLTPHIVNALQGEPVSAITCNPLKGKGPAKYRKCSKKPSKEDPVFAITDITDQRKSPVIIRKSSRLQATSILNSTVNGKGRITNYSLVGQGNNIQQASTSSISAEINLDESKSCEEIPVRKYATRRTVRNFVNPPVLCSQSNDNASENSRKLRSYNASTVAHEISPVNGVGHLEFADEETMSTGSARRQLQFSEPLNKPFPTITIEDDADDFCVVVASPSEVDISDDESLTTPRTLRPTSPEPGSSGGFQSFTIISSLESGLTEISSLSAMFDLVATTPREIAIMTQDLGGSLDIIHRSESTDRMMPIFNYADDESAFSPAYHKDPKYDSLYSPSVDLRLSDSE